MKILTKNEHLSIREMEETEDDLRQHLLWMTDPDTMKYWDGMTVHYTYEDILQMYRESLEEGVTPYFVELDGRPIGYIQTCVIPDAAGYDCPAADWEKFFRPGEVLCGIDMFIGEVSCRDRGLGTEMLRLMIPALFEKYGADAMIIDPKAHNARAIACYRKCGFRDCFLVPAREEQDGIWHDSLIMRMDRQEKG